MNRLESIKKALAAYKADEDLLSPPERGYLEDVEYLLQHLETAERAIGYMLKSLEVIGANSKEVETRDYAVKTAKLNRDMLGKMDEIT